MPKFRSTRWLAGMLSILMPAATATAEYLFDGYLIPGFDGNPNTEYSAWEIFYSPGSAAPNYPDFAAPNGSYQSASLAGFTLPPGSTSPSDPLAFWDVDNPTITQTGAFAFIIAPGFTGNIYSFSGVTRYEVDDTTDYTLGTVVFQFQADGTLVDFDSIKLIYDNGSGLQELAPDEYIREYASNTSGFGGFTNRNALQWDLTGLGITEYQIVLESSGSSMSFQQAGLDTAATYLGVVPEARTWVASGAGNWSDGANWAEGSTSVLNGNVWFANGAPVVVQLDGDRTVGELRFENAADVTIESSVGSVLTSNTGIVTTPAAIGDYTITTDYELGAFTPFNIDGGRVELAGEVSGDYGLIKTGEGTLVMNHDNTFTMGVGVQGGTLRLAGVNSYTGATSVVFGRLEVASDAPNGLPGALGDASSNIAVGADDTLFSGITTPAELVIVGDHIIDRDITLSVGAFDKALGARNTTTGAIFSGSISLSANSDNIRFAARNVSDMVAFTGPITGGDSQNQITINGDGNEGIVQFSGSDKTYNTATVVAAGELRVNGGITFGGNGDALIERGAELWVDNATFETDLLTVGNANGTGTPILRVTNGGQLTATTGLVQHGAETVLSGSGTLMTLDGLTLDDAAGANRLAVTEGAALLINGNFTSSGTDVIEQTVGGGSGIEVTGTAQLGGTLNVTLSSQANPMDGDIFTLISAGTLTGSYSTINLPDLGAGYQWLVTQTATALTIELEQLETGYNLWATTYGLDPQGDGAPSVDEEFDSLANLLEFGFGLDPTVSDAVPLVVVDATTFTPGVPVMEWDVSNGTELTIQFVRRKNATLENLQYRVEVSEDLANWTSVDPVLTTISDAGGDYEVVSATFSVTPDLDPGVHFARVQVTQVGG